MLNNIPYSDDEFTYANEFEEGAEYPVRYATSKATNEKFVMVDEQSRAKGLNHYQIGRILTSPNKTRVAWVEDTKGELGQTLYVKELKKDGRLLYTVPDASPQFVWGQNDEELFYTRLDENGRYKQIRFINVLKGIDEEVFTEPESRYLTFPKRMLSGKGILIGSTDYNDNETRALWFGNDLDSHTPVISRDKKLGHRLQHIGDKFYVLLTENNLSVIYAFDSINTPKEEWVPVITVENEGLVSEYFLKDYIAYTVRNNGNDTLYKYNVNTGETSEVVVSEGNDIEIVIQGFPNDEQGNILRLQFQSHFIPRRVVELDFSTGENNLLAEIKVPGFDASKYDLERLMIPSHDGVLVPVTIIKRNDLAPSDEPPPVYQYVYGGYNIGISPEFPGYALSLIDRGFTYVVSHVRGGNELGKGWHEGGRLMNRKNSHKDFIAISEFLVESGRAAFGGISVSGESAAGMVFGVAVNERPGLYKSVTGLVPVLDLLNKLLNPDLFITKTEWSEVGNPIESKEAFEYIRDYSPLENIKPQPYPHFYITGATNDYAVSYWESLKWAAAIRKNQTNDALSLVSIRVGSHIASGQGRVEMDFAKQMLFMQKMHENDR